MAEQNAIPSDPAQHETWFLGQLEQLPDAAPVLLDYLDAQAVQGRLEQADAWSEMLLDSLVERGAIAPAVECVRRRAAWWLGAPEKRALWMKLAQRALSPARELQGLVNQAGFEAPVTSAECFRRLHLLLTLKPGLMCLDKTWGFGVVKSVDVFYGRVTIDFEKKRGHEMSLAYVAEALQLPAKDHLMVLRHQQPEELKTMVRQDAAEVVRRALRSYGVMTADALQKRLVPDIVAEADWKRFWDAARKGLKQDPLVKLPAKRTETIQLLQKAHAYDADWFAIFAKERHVQPILDHSDELIAAGQDVTWTDATRAIAADRLAFAAKGAGTRHTAQLARLLMNADALGLVLPEQAHVPTPAVFLDAKLLIATLHDLPVRLAAPFLDWLATKDTARAAELLLAILPQLELSALTEAMELLLKGERAETAAQVFRASVARQSAEVEFLLWMFRHPEQLNAWVPETWPVLAGLTLTELEKDYMGERLRAQNQLRELIEVEDWVRAALTPMSAVQRKDFLERVKKAPNWAELDRRSAMGCIVKLFPELAGVLANKPEAAAAPARPAVTARRSYRARQLQFEKITNVEIPRIAREIGVARSYGDLRENFEYKAAKEMQTVLLRRQAELEEMLGKVQPSDFRDLPHDRAGLGTCITLQHTDGRRETFNILGEWDRDEALGIISCNSQLARAVEGKLAGETVRIPAHEGEAECVLAEVGGLSDAIQAWISSEPPPPADVGAENKA
jgi:transcription elongation GreA/GreB family factor